MISTWLQRFAFTAKFIQYDTAFFYQTWATAATFTIFQCVYLTNAKTVTPRHFDLLSFHGWRAGTFLTVRMEPCEPSTGSKQVGLRFESPCARTIIDLLMNVTTPEWWKHQWVFNEFSPIKDMKKMELLPHVRPHVKPKPSLSGCIKPPKQMRRWMSQCRCRLFYSCLTCLPKSQQHHYRVKCNNRNKFLESSDDNQFNKYETTVIALLKRPTCWTSKFSWNHFPKVRSWDHDFFSQCGGWVLKTNTVVSNVLMVAPSQ